MRLTNFATASFRSANVEAMGTVFRSWICSRATAPDGVDGCVVIPGTRRFQIAMGVDANEVGGEEDGCNLIIIFCEVEFHDGAVIGDRRWGCGDFVTLDLGEGWQITFYETLEKW